MGLLDWVKKDSAVARNQNDDRGGGWESLNVYFYHADGRYPPASHAETPEQFGAMIPQIRKQLDNKLELRITNSGDHLLFHATDKGIEWDGIGLGQHLDRARDVCTGSREERNTSDARLQQSDKGRSWER